MKEGDAAAEFRRAPVRARISKASRESHRLFEKAIVVEQNVRVIGDRPASPGGIDSNGRIRQEADRRPFLLVYDTVSDAHMVGRSALLLLPTLEVALAVGLFAVVVSLGGGCYGGFVVREVAQDKGRAAARLGRARLGTCCPRASGESHRSFERYIVIS